VLTIGDGLVTVIPALMISISGGLIVTRASSDARLGSEFRRQIWAIHTLMLAGESCCAAACRDAQVAVSSAGCGAGFAGWQMRKKEVADAAAPAEADRPARQGNIEALLRVEPLAIEVGLGLVGW